MCAMAWRTARVTLARARSEAAPRAPVPTAQPDRPGQLADEEVPFSAGLGVPLGVPAGLRLLAVRLDLGEPQAVQILGLRVEQHAGVRQAGRARLAGLSAAARPRRRRRTHRARRPPGPARGPRVQGR